MFSKDFKVGLSLFVIGVLGSLLGLWGFITSATGAVTLILTGTAVAVIGGTVLLLSCVLQN
ncbi:MAG: hypothetical protein Q7K26_02350 [bacterium]|nr:hypothetical protein [bacterium]